MQRQEVEFCHRAFLLSDVVRQFYSEQVNPGSGQAFREEFLDAWGRLPLQGRRSFLESVQESSLASQAGPCGQLAAAYVATELTENDAHVTQSDALSAYRAPGIQCECSSHTHPRSSRSQ